MQLFEAILGWYFPGSHAPQAIAPLCGCNSPGLQLKHTAEPDAFAKRPGAQDAHDVAPIDALNCPTSHITQLVDACSV